MGEYGLCVVRVVEEVVVVAVVGEEEEREDGQGVRKCDGSVLAF
jgi:hypothetical protein